MCKPEVVEGCEDVCVSEVICAGLYTRGAFRKSSYHYRHHSIFWYGPYMQNTEQIQVLYVFREVRIPNSSCIFEIGVDECHI